MGFDQGYKDQLEDGQVISELMRVRRVFWEQSVYLGRQAHCQVMRGGGRLLGRDNWTVVGAIQAIQEGPSPPFSSLPTYSAAKELTNRVYIQQTWQLFSKHLFTSSLATCMHGRKGNNP